MALVQIQRQKEAAKCAKVVSGKAGSADDGGEEKTWMEGVVKYADKPNYINYKSNL